MLRLALAAFLAAAPMALALAQEPESPKELWKKCGSEIPWLTDGRVYKDNMQGGGMAKEKVKLGELWDEVKAKAKETGRPILWYIPKVQGVQMYRDVILTNYMHVAIWSDEQIIDLVNTRFVPLRAAAAGVLANETKIKALRVVEPAIVILDAEGTELHTIERIRTFNADFIAMAIRTALDKVAPLPAPTDASGEDLMKGGWLEAAAKKLAGNPLKLAEIRRREGKLDEALKLLEGAKDAAPVVATLRGRTLLAAGRIADAKAELEKAATPEGQYYLAHAERMLRNTGKASEIWAKIAETSPDTRWGWRAASNVAKFQDTKPVGPATASFEDVIWPTPSAALATGTRWERTPADLEDVAKRAVAWLLRNQFADGSWSDSRYAYWDSPKSLPNVYMAITGLACAALLEWRDVDPKGVDAALALAEPYLLNDENMARGKTEESYGDSYRLVYLGRKALGQTDAAGKAKTVEQMNEIIGKLSAKQTKPGFWIHEYPNPFVTATVLQALLLAKKAGATVEDKVLSQGAKALKSSKNAKGYQNYGTGKGSTPDNSSGRNPSCEGVLLELKETERELFESVMENFWKYLDKRESVRVCDYHTLQELAGFFFTYNCYHTSEAMALQEGAALEESRAKFRVHFTKIPEVDGSFIDSHEMGKSYGTANALLVLKNATRK